MLNKSLSNSEKMTQLLQAMQNSNEPGWYQGFKQALKDTGEEYSAYVDIKISHGLL